MNKNENNCCEHVKGVGCDVTSCKYNDTMYHRCSAEHINVQGEKAHTMGETFCQTFVAKS